MSADTPSPSFTAEPRQPAAEAVGGWSADDSREYREWALREEIRTFAALYGWDAATKQMRAAEIEECE